MISSPSLENYLKQNNFPPSELSRETKNMSFEHIRKPINKRNVIVFLKLNYKEVGYSLYIQDFST